MKRQSRHVVVTGASAGVGRVTAQQFAREGATLSLIARSEDALKQAVQECRQLGATAEGFVADVSDDMAVTSAAAEAQKRHGPVDVWVNNAMVTVVSPVAQMTAAEFRRVTDVTYLGAVHGTLAALESMRKRGQGVIIQVGSALAYRSIPLQSAYCAAKHALLGFTESLRTELLHEKSRIHVCMVQLPALNTPQFNWARNRLPKRLQPVPPVFAPEVAARAIVRASHQLRREWFVGFPTVKAVWADKLFPGIADRYLARNGIDSQQDVQPDSADRPDNLWDAMPAQYYSSHGRFGDVSKPQSRWQALSEHRGRVCAALLALGTVMLIAWRAGWL